MKKYATIKDYIDDQTPGARKALNKMRNIVRKCAPKADEVMSYGMPAYKLEGMLLYYAAFAKHYSLFPMRSGITKFAPKLKKYKTSAGTVQFRYEEPFPEKLVAEIVKFRVQENLEKAELRKLKTLRRSSSQQKNKSK